MLVTFIIFKINEQGASESKNTLLEAKKNIVVKSLMIVMHAQRQITKIGIYQAILVSDKLHSNVFNCDAFLAFQRIQLNVSYVAIQ